MRVLLIEDESRLAKALIHVMKRENIIMDWRDTATGGVDAISTGSYDCFIIDIQLPDGDGLALIQDTRESGCDTPILVVSARNRAEDRVLGLNAGADDYLGKPFDNEELVARVRALVRRSISVLESDTIPLGDATFFLRSRTLTLKGKSVEFSTKEFLLLEYLVRNQGEVVPRDELLARVWGPDAVVADNALETYIYFIRKKCEKIGVKLDVQALRGRGYRLR